MAAVPDMSHLTPEERSTIEEVMIRQKQEEEKENEIMRAKQDEVKLLEERIRACSEKHKKAGVELHATCQICLKTKFADGVGHICNYCTIRCCARCGGKVTLRSNKVIWVCILCRKKQELLSKTGQWITKAGGLGAGENAMLRRMQDMQDQYTDLVMTYGQPTVEAGPPRSSVHPPQQYSVHQTQSAHPSQPVGAQAGLQPQRSFSSSEEERITPVPDESEKGDKPPSMVVTSSSSREKPGDGMNRQFLAHPIPWQESRDGQNIIGHMVLQKQLIPEPGVLGSDSSSRILGLKVVGGLITEDGLRRAFIQKVKSGSTADIEGQLRPGDEVISWNGRILQGKSSREVSALIAESRKDHQVELVVSRNISSMTEPMVLPTSTTPMATRKFGIQSQWKQKHAKTISGPQQPHPKGLKKCILWELYDARREKPSVLVTAPGSPDLPGQGTARHMQHLSCNANVGGSLQVKLSFDPVALKLIVTLICAAGLTPRSNGQPRNPYAKIFLLPDRSEKSKRRTKTLANTNDPMWNQTFVYDGNEPELGKRALEITVWDYRKYDTNDFLGEAVLELATARLDEEPEWHHLTGHGEHHHHSIGYYQEPDDMAIIPVDCHLSPPSTTSRQSDSDPSECDIMDCDVSREERRTADGASISSIGSSSSHYSSPPPERELCMDGEHRSRRDMPPQGRKRAALMIRDLSSSISGYQTYRKDDIHREMMGHRSHSAAPMDSPSFQYRGRSQSPTGHRSLSPPEHRSMPYSDGYVPPRFSSRSATATPTGSPKKRQLPLIPAALKERAVLDHEERARFMRHRSRQMHTTYRCTGMGGWEKHNSGLSDSDLPSISNAYQIHRPRSPDKDVLGDPGDSDMESVGSVTSSAFSTQSERPRASRGLIEYTGQSSSYEKTSRSQQGDNEHDEHGKRGQFTRSLSNTDAPQDEQVDGDLSDTAMGLNADDSSKRGRKSSPGSKSGSGSSSGGGSAVQYQSSGLGKKSNSTSQLSATGRKRRLGFGKKGKSSFTVHRSEEVLPEDTASGRSGRQPSSASSDGEGSGDGDSWSPSLRMTGETGPLKNFIEDLGPGQVVGRQALGARCLGAIQLSLTQKKGYLEVEVIRARDLKPKQGSKVIPSSYVKVYLVNGKKCIAKAKTTTARKTLDPFYQQSLSFRENCRGCILQVTVWGDYGQIGAKKVFMGIAQIVLDELDANDLVFGWYKLFGNISL